MLKEKSLQQEYLQKQLLGVIGQVCTPRIGTDVDLSQIGRDLDHLSELDKNLFFVLKKTMQYNPD